MPTTSPRRPWILRVPLLLILCWVVAGLQTEALAAISIRLTTLSRFPGQYAPGSTVTLEVRDTLPPPPAGRYEWLHNDVPIPGATSGSLTLNNLSTADTGNYQLKLTSATATELSETITINVLPFPPSPVDPTFSVLFPDGATYGRILGVLADNSILVRTTYPNPPVDNIVQFRPDGSIAKKFPVPFYDISILATCPNGSLIVGNPSLGFRLTSDGTEHKLSLPQGFDPDKPLSAAAVQPDGRLLIAQGNLLARLNADDSVDPTFQYTPTLGTKHYIYRIKFDRTGRVYVTANPDPYTAGQLPEIARFLSSGEQDPDFTMVRADRGHVNEFEPYPLSDGRILIRGTDNIGTYLRMVSDSGASAPWAYSTYLTNSGFTPMAVDPAGRVFYLDAQSVVHRAIVTATTLVDDPTFYQGYGGGTDLMLMPNGALLVAGRFGSLDGSDDTLRTNLALLRSTDVVSFPPVPSIRPSITGELKKGGVITLTSDVAGTGPFSYQWIALDRQPLPRDSTSPSLSIVYSAPNFGRYQLEVTGRDGVKALSDVFGVWPPSASSLPPYLANLSGRAMTGSGEDTVIAGLATPKYFYPTSRVLFRGAGPALHPLGVDGFLQNPAIDVFNASGTLVANNDQWSVNAGIATIASAVGAFGFAEGSNDAALIYEFPSGSAGTIMLKSQTKEGNGIGLLEIYPAPYQPDERHAPLELTNLSLRARTGPGEQTAIAGFVIVDPYDFDRPAKVLLRAVGPTLAASGIVHPLENPVLTVYNAKGEIVAQNDDWPSHLTAEVTAYDAACTSVGAFSLPQGSKDSGLLLDLPAGAYSMHATGGMGVVLLEIYLVR